MRPISDLKVAYDVTREAYVEPARVNGLEPIEPVHVLYGNVALLAGDRDTSVEMRLAGTNEIEPMQPIRVRPAYRPEPRARLAVDELVPEPVDVGAVVAWMLVAITALYFGGHLLSALVR